MSASVGVFTGKCSTCSAVLKKKKYFACSECGIFLCKIHYRIHPDTAITYCLKCYERALTDEVSKEHEPRLKTLKSSLFKIKEKLKLSRKEKLEKAQTIERLQKLISNNEKAFSEKNSNLREKIKQEEDNEKIKSQASIDISRSIQDIESSLSKEKESLSQVNSDHSESLKILESLNQENAKLRTQIQEIHKEIKNRVPYDRLRNLACSECKEKVKKKYRKEILAANANRVSVLDSVLAQRMSSRPSVVPPSGQGKTEQKEVCCECF